MRYSYRKDIDVSHSLKLCVYLYHYWEISFIICHFVVGGHMVEHMCAWLFYRDISTWDHAFHGGVCDTYEIQGNYRSLQEIRSV